MQQRKVLAALAACRTADMGGHVHRCTACLAETPLYNSCGDRHCPQCQAGHRAAWLEARRDELLPVEYFHVVFTVPHELVPLAAAHPAAFYDVLFRAVRETLLEIAATPRHLGARIGGLMVLHTWGQNLELHPHVHVIVPAGGLSPDGSRWVACQPGFFLPVNGQITFRYKDYANGHRCRRMTLAACEFLRRFAHHILPRGFVRIRSFGLLANRCREQQLARCRQLLGASEPAVTSPTAEREETVVPGADPRRCSRCGQGVLKVVSEIPRPSLWELVARTYQAKGVDSS